MGLDSQRFDNAIALARAGWRIIPVHDVARGACSCGRSDCDRSAGKHPRLSKWGEIATTDEPTIRGWFAKWPAMNYGIATGPESNIWILDVEAEGLATLEELVNENGALPVTFKGKSGGGGEHYYYRWPADGTVIPSRGVPGVAKIDTKGVGGQVVGPGSRSPKGEYSILADEPIVDAPAWLLELVTRPKQHTTPTPPDDRQPYRHTTGRNAFERAVNYIAPIEGADGTGGHRGHDKTFTVARIGYTGYELNVEETYRLLADHYNHRCNPPWSKRELRHKAQSAADTPSKHPRGYLLHAERNGTHPGAGPTPTGTTTTASGDWPDPIPLHTDPTVPAFPVETLPDWLREWATAQALELQVPVDLPAIAGLVVASAGLSRKVVVTPWDGWNCEPVNLFGIVALPPGERKSQTFRKAMSPVAALETYLQNEAKPRIAEAESLHRVATKRVEHLESQLAKAAQADRPQLEQSLSEALQELERCAVPVLPILHVSDDTPEKLSSELIRQSGRLLAASPEAAALGNIVRDKKVNVDVFLMGHAGDDIKTGRIGRGREGIDRAALSCLYSPQPCVLENLAETPELRGRGFLARWLYSLPKSRVGERDIATPAVPDPVRNRYLDSIHHLWLIEYSDPQHGTPNELFLTDDAHEVLTDFLRWIETELRPDGSLAGLGGWGNKLGGLCARLSAILHAGDGIESGSSWLMTRIEADTVRRAVRLCREYAIGHAQAAFDLMGVSETVVNARKVLAWIKSNATEGTFSRRDAYRGTRPTFETADDIQPTLDLLERHYLIRPATVEPKSGPGRKPSAEYQVNPAAFG